MRHAKHTNLTGKLRAVTGQVGYVRATLVLATSLLALVAFSMPPISAQAGLRSPGHSTAEIVGLRLSDSQGMPVGGLGGPRYGFNLWESHGESGLSPSRVYRRGYFAQPDPNLNLQAPGGLYSLCEGDPVNCTDFNGRAGNWLSRIIPAFTFGQFNPFADDPEERLGPVGKSLAESADAVKQAAFFGGKLYFDFTFDWTSSAVAYYQHPSRLNLAFLLLATLPGPSPGGAADDVLEIGIGRATNSLHRVREYGESLTLVDIDPAKIERASHRGILEETGGHAIVTDTTRGLNGVVSSGRFDRVDYLHPLPLGLENIESLRAATDALRPGGTIHVSTEVEGLAKLLTHEAVLEELGLRVVDYTPIKKVDDYLMVTGNGEALQTKIFELGCTTHCSDYVRPGDTGIVFEKVRSGGSGTTGFL